MDIRLLTSKQTDRQRNKQKQWPSPSLWREKKLKFWLWNVSSSWNFQVENLFPVMEMKVKLGIFLNNKLHLDIIFISKQNYIKKNFFSPAAFFPTLLSVTAPAHRNKQPFTPVVILESPVNRTWCISLNSGKTPIGRGKTCSLYTEKPRWLAYSNPGNSCCKATVKDTNLSLFLSKKKKVYLFLSKPKVFPEENSESYSNIHPKVEPLYCQKALKRGNDGGAQQEHWQRKQEAERKEMTIDLLCMKKPHLH